MGVAWEDPHKDTVDPKAWAIVDGKLYLTHTVRGLDGWRANASENIKTANENWSNVKTLPEPVIIGSPCPDSPPSVVISLSGGGRQVLVGGQTAIDKDGNVVGKGDMSAQIEQVGKNIQASWDSACCRSAGHYADVGLVGDRIDIPLFPRVSREQTFHGSFWGNYTDLSEVMALAAQGKIRHTLKMFTFDQINEYIDLLRTGEVVGRAVMKF